MIAVDSSGCGTGCDTVSPTYLGCLQGAEAELVGVAIELDVDVERQQYKPADGRKTNHAESTRKALQTDFAHDRVARILWEAGRAGGSEGWDGREGGREDGTSNRQGYLCLNQWWATRKVFSAGTSPRRPAEHRSTH
jgi:hypothetical protein